MQIVQASSDDAVAVLDIFNYYVEHSFASYYKTKVGCDFADRLLGLGQRYPFVAVKDDSGKVLGFGVLHPYHSGDTFDRTAEVSYFFHPDCTGQGLGAVLLAHLEAEARERGIHSLLANISSLNEASLKFHRKHGFQEVARLPRIGEKFGEEFDVVYMQKWLFEEPQD